MSGINRGPCFGLRPLSGMHRPLAAAESPLVDHDSIRILSELGNRPQFRAEHPEWGEGDAPKCCNRVQTSAISAGLRRARFPWPASGIDRPTGRSGRRPWAVVRLGAIQGEADAEEAAPADGALDLEGAAVVADDPVADREPQPRPCRPRAWS